MATVLKIKKTKGVVVRTFLFEDGEVKSLNKSSSNLSVSLSTPKDSPTDASEPFIINLGVDRILTFDWKLYKITTDRSDGTNTPVVKTYAEMLNYLENTIAWPGIGLADYEITIYDKFRTYTGIYSFEDFSIDVNDGLYPTGSFKFKLKTES